MVVNTYYKFIFVHVPKNGGRSVKRSLATIRGNRKHWMAVSNHETLGGFYDNFKTRANWRDKILGRNPSSQYFRFAFVRNPWDRMSSLYHFLTERRARDEVHAVRSFKHFLQQMREGVPWIQNLHSTRSQLEYLTLEDNRVCLDYLGHFEFLEDDFAAISEAFGCPLTLSHVNRSVNSQVDYRTRYDAEMIEIVASRFAEEIDRFGYVFEQSSPRRRFSGPIDYVRDWGDGTRQGDVDKVA